MNQFFLGGNATLQANGIQDHPESASVAVVSFTNGTKALVSKNLTKGYFQPATDADGNPGVVPTFLSSTGMVMPGFEVVSMDGTPWIQNKSNRKGISLPK